MADAASLLTFASLLLPDCSRENLSHCYEPLNWVYIIIILFIKKKAARLLIIDNT